MSDAAAEEVQLVTWPDLPLVRIYALEASMAASVETETIGPWVPAVDADVSPNVANGADQQELARMEPAAEDPDVPCRDAADRVVAEHHRQQEAVGADRAPVVEPYRKTVAAVPNVVAMHPEAAGHRHRA